jgi:hypothetical protein
MMKPKIVEHDVLTGITSDREMTDEEYEALLATGWTPEGETQE